MYLGHGHLDVPTPSLTRVSLPFGIRGKSLSSDPQRLKPFRCGPHQPVWWCKGKYSDTLKCISLSPDEEGSVPRSWSRHRSSEL